MAYNEIYKKVNTISGQCVVLDGRKDMKGNILLKRITAVLLAGTMALGLAACGSGGNGGGNSENDSSAGSNSSGSGAQNTGGKEDSGDYVYVPRYYDLPVDAESSYSWFGSVAFEGDRLYYVHSFSKDGTSNSNWCYICLLYRSPSLRD